MGPTYSMQVIANMTPVHTDAKLSISIFPHARCEYSFKIREPHL